MSIQVNRHIKRSSRKGPRRRRGAVAVEFAVTAGVALAFFFAAFEFCRVAMIRHTVDNAVYEAARAGIVPGATRAEVETKARQILSTLGVSQSSVVVTPRTITDNTADVTVDITVPIDKNTFGTAVFFAGKKVERSLTMIRETVR